MRKKSSLPYEKSLADKKEEKRYKANPYNRILENYYLKRKTRKNHLPYEKRKKKDIKKSSQ